MELDLSIVVKRKIKVIKSKSTFYQFCVENYPNFKIGESGSNPKITSDKYSLRSCDLNNIESLGKILQEEGLDPEAPTLVISECVMIYLEPEAVQEMINFVSKTFKQSIFMDYEMFNPTSNFGKMMVKNFKERGVPLVSIDNFRTLPEIEKMYTQGGFDSCRAIDMHTIFTQFLPKSELMRIRKLEWLDEIEEIALIQSHYFISIAKKNGLDSENWFKELGFESLSG